MTASHFRQLSGAPGPAGRIALVLDSGDRFKEIGTTNMCGFVAVSGRRDVTGVITETAIARLSHRGPDGTGEFISSGRDCAFAHARLAILDLSAAGHQPMADSTGRFTCVFNGELFNWRELRVELSRAFNDINWRSSTDTEVLVEGFARLGPAFLRRLNGIFAIAIYDNETREMTVLRDPCGVKPLFLTRQRDIVALASELAPLLTLRNFKYTFRNDAHAEMLAFMFVPEPYTTVEEITKVPPGTLMVFREGVEVRTEDLFPWTTESGAELRGDDEELSHEFERLLEQAVRRQSHADVPVGLMLSGGIDSSVIGALAVRAGCRVHASFTMGTAKSDAAHDAQSDDLTAARTVAAHLDLPMRVIEADRDFLAMLPSLAPHFSEGLCDPASIPTYIIARAAAAEGVRVLLTGQAADELLAGYRRALVATWFHRFPAMGGRSPFAAALNLAGRALPTSIALGRRLRRLGQVLKADPRHRLLQLYTWASPELISLLLVDPQSSDWIGRFEQVASVGVDRSVLDTISALDHHYDLRSLNLAYVDRMTMAASVEGRVPFLDFDVVRFCRALPARLRIGHFSGKLILRRVARRLLPSSIVNRPKAGFGLPVRSWYRDPSTCRALFETFTPPLPFQPDFVETLFNMQGTHDTDIQPILHTMYCILLARAELAKWAGS